MTIKSIVNHGAPDEYFIIELHQLPVDVPGEGRSIRLDDGHRPGVSFLITLFLRAVDQRPWADPHCRHGVCFHEGEAELKRDVLGTGRTLGNGERIRHHIAGQRSGEEDIEDPC